MQDAVLGARTLHRGWFSLLMLRLRLGGREYERMLVEHPSGASVLPFDPDRRVATVLRQTRYAPLHLGQPMLLEAVGGVTEDEAPEETARREVLEEVGLRLRTLEPVGLVWMTPSSTTERVRLYVGEYGAGDRIGPGGGAEHEEDEQIDFHEAPLADLGAMLDGDAMMDAKLFMLLQALRLRRPELFER